MNAHAAALAPDKSYLSATPEADGLVRYQLYIDGRFVDPATDDWIDAEDPVAGEVWARVPRAGAEDADRAVAAAHRAFTSGAWPAMSRVAARARSCASWAISSRTTPSGSRASR